MTKETNARAPDTEVPETQVSTQDNSKVRKEKYDRQRDQFLLTLNNPLDYGYSHEMIKEIIHKN